MAKPQTLFDKIWQNHLVDTQEDGTCLIYIDRHLVHEVTSPQAFEGLRNNNLNYLKICLNSIKKNSKYFLTLGFVFFHITNVLANKRTNSHVHMTLESEYMQGNRQKVRFLKIGTLARRQS